MSEWITASEIVARETEMTPCVNARFDAVAERLRQTIFGSVWSEVMAILDRVPNHSDIRSET